MAPLCLILALFLTESSALFVQKHLKFADCLTNKAGEYANVDHVSLSPDPPVLPGDITVGANVRLNHNLAGPGLKVDVNIYKVLLGQKTRVPCISNVGSCEYDFCTLLGSTNGSNTDCGPELMGTGLPCKCPIAAGTYNLAPHVFNIPKIDGVWSWLASGDYSVHVEITDTTLRTPFKAACYDVDVSLTNSHSTGFLFG